MCRSTYTWPGLILGFVTILFITENVMSFSLTSLPSYLPIFRPFGPQFDLKIKVGGGGEWAPRAPPRDPPMILQQQGNAELRNVIESHYLLGMNFKEILLLVGLTHGFYVKCVTFKEH